MPAIPKNNLKERLLKLGYNSNSFKIVPPALDNSKVVHERRSLESQINYKAQPSGFQIHNPYSEDQPSFNAQPNSLHSQLDFKPPPIANIDEWSDFEDD